ncbi:MAG: AAA family ATPase [Castellaniella sp.]|nr:AAA family ATPase [Castellaniella sp.]
MQATLKKPKAPGGAGAIDITRSHSVVCRDETSISDGTVANNIQGHAPEPLQDLPGWLVWKYEQNAGGKPRKVPYYAKSGTRRKGIQGSPSDRRELVDFATAREVAQQRGFDGVGLALMPEFGIVALDFDDCVADGAVRPDVEALVSGTYAEFSPSGHGVRAFMRGNLGDHKDTSEKDGRFKIEVFSTKGFVTFTGRPLPVTEFLGGAVVDVSDQVQALAAERFGQRQVNADAAHVSNAAPLGLTPQQIADCLAVLDPDMGHDDWRNVGMALHHETSGEGFAYWDDWSAEAEAKYPGTDSLRQRWDSFGQGHQGQPVTARTLVHMANQNGAGVVPPAAGLDDFDDLDAEPATDERSKLRFEVIPAADFVRQPIPGWIIKGVIPRADVVMVYGASGAGKSFLVLDMAAAIARGLDWRGHKTKQGRVVYIAAEGAGGFRKRVRAYEQHNGVPLTNFGVIDAAPNFLQKPDAVAVARSVVASGGASLVVVDTLAQVTPGANENASDDMTAALAHCRAIGRATGAVVLLVHHAGKDESRGARGWSGLRAAVDAEIEVSRPQETGPRLARSTKQKDGEDGVAWGFDLAVVHIGEDEDGDPITSCVVVPTEAPKPAPKRKPMGVWEQRALDALSELMLGGEAAASQVVQHMVQHTITPESGKRDRRREYARQGLEAVCRGGHGFTLENDQVTVAP